MKIQRIYILFAVLTLTIGAIPYRATLCRPVVAVIHVLRGKQTVADRAEQFGDVVRERLRPEFERLGVAYPPSAIISEMLNKGINVISEGN